MTGYGSLAIDDNYKPVQGLGLLVSSAKKLVGNNTTVNVPIFTVTGSILVNAIYGVVTTALGNNTAAYWRTNDGSTQNSITLSTGTTLTSSIVGASISKQRTAGNALTLMSGTSAQISESTSSNLSALQQFILTANPLATSNIEFVYTTTDTPTTGAITFYVGYIPLGLGSKIVAL